MKQNLIKENQLQMQKSAYWTQWIRNSIYQNHEDWTWLNRYDETVSRITIADLADFARWAISDARFIRAVMLPSNIPEENNPTRQQ